MRVPITVTVKGSNSTAGNSLLSCRGRIGAFVARFGQEVRNSRINNFYGWFVMATTAFARLFKTSAAMIVQDERYTYFINEADFSHGRFMKSDYMGTEDLGWDRFDRFFARELEEAEEAGSFAKPAKAIYIPNINSDRILVFNREGEVVERQVDQEKIEDLLFDRDLQTRGSVMLVPIIARSSEQGKRAMAYLYSPETDHFDLPQAGYAAFLLAGAAEPVIKRLLHTS